MHFLIMDLGEDEIVLGYPWLATFQLHMDWKNATLDEEEQPLCYETTPISFLLLYFVDSLFLSCDRHVVK